MTAGDWLLVLTAIVFFAAIFVPLGWVLSEDYWRGRERARIEQAARTRERRVIEPSPYERRAMGVPEWDR